MDRAMRRHHRDRLKRGRRYYWGRDISKDPELYNTVVNTPTTCSCHMCGNERKHFGNKTIQERRHEEAYRVDTKSKEWPDV